MEQMIDLAAAAQRSERGDADQSSEAHVSFSQLASGSAARSTSAMTAPPCRRLAAS